MNWEKDLFSCTKESTNNFTLKADQELTFFIWNKRATIFHNHENYVEIFILTKGRALHTLNGFTKKLKVGDATIIVPGDQHQISPYKNCDMQFINLSCYIQTTENILRSHFHSSLSTLSSFTFALSLLQQRTINLFTEAILSSKKRKNDIIILSSFISYMLGAFLTTDNSRQEVKDRPQWLDDFLIALSNIDYETTKISDLYKLSSYSQSILSVQFQKYLGMTLVQYVNNLKLDYACRLLEKTNFTTAHIANKIGFSNLSHFNRLFKKKYNKTPSEYRKEHQTL